MLTSSDYLSLWNTTQLTTDSRAVAQLDYICRTVFINQAVYQAVQRGTRDFYGISVPWPIVAAIHFRESGFNFNCHLHNGDPLTARTVHVPAGRPVLGQPPFTWTESAIDAFKGLVLPLLWDIPSCLLFLERYNGEGYHKHGVNTPYLWDFTNHYESGLYLSDGNFDPNTKENRPGCVSILMSLASKGVSLDFTSLGSGSSPTIH